MEGTAPTGFDPILGLMIGGGLGGIIFLIAAPLIFRHYMKKSRDQYKD
jgi:hypothetical protein